jgi:virginiamycin B lyase
MKILNLKFLFLYFLSNFLNAKEIQFLLVDQFSKPLKQAMVTLGPSKSWNLNISDNGYPKPNIPYVVEAVITKFTNNQGQVSFTCDDKNKENYQLKIRKYAYQDKFTDLFSKKIILDSETDPIKLSEAKPANIWLGGIEFSNPHDKKIFQMQCGFCHQLGSSFMRLERSAQEWSEIIPRMINYGSRLPTDLQKISPEILVKEFNRLRNNPKFLVEPTQWPAYLSEAQISEWPMGDSMSQLHDAIVLKTGIILNADNIQDRVYAVNPKTNEIVVYKIPHKKNDQPGGLISARLKTFPKHDSISNAHSLAESKVDGHVFITPSAQQRLVEFIPQTGEFILHQMEQGFYPHTIRIDASDQVWFTLALSNQVAKFNRINKTFTYYDLATRSFKEKLITKFIKYLFILMDWGVPVGKWIHIDREYMGTPLVYGIDITPDQRVWFTRLHTNEIGVIDPKTNLVQMIKTPFIGPRRLRSDNIGNLWITSYAESKIAKYDPKLKVFEMFDLPVVPLGSETPYALNYDVKRNWIWVTGNQSDSLFALDINLKTWRNFPLPRRTSFTRDIEFDEDGNAYVSNSNFASWQIEDSQPTLMKVDPDI